MGIMGKTHGVKIAARPKPKATSRNAPKLWVPGLTCADGAAAARVFGGPVASAYPAGMGGGAPVPGWGSGQLGDGDAALRCNAHLFVACLVTSFRGTLRGARRGVRLQ